MDSKFVEQDICENCVHLVPLDEGAEERYCEELLTSKNLNGVCPKYEDVKLD